MLNCYVGRQCAMIGYKLTNEIIMVMWIVELMLAFVIGGIPFGMIVCQSLNLQSPKTYGSKNIGASNVARQNIYAGALTLLLDALKGGLAIILFGGHGSIIFAVVAGHCFSPLLHFNGGKGVATALGAVTASTPHISAVLMIIWLTVFLKKNVPATASITCSVILAFYAALLKSPWLVATALMIIIRHIPNVRKAIEA